VLFAISLSAAVSAQAHAEAADPAAALFDEGNKAYFAGSYAVARDKFASLVESHRLEDAALYHNLGNAHFRLGQYGAAILYYQRGLRLEPPADVADALRRNLDTARRVLQTRYRAASETALVFADPSGVLWQVTHLVSGNTLAIVFAAVWILFFGLLALRRLRPSFARWGGRLAVFPGLAVVLTGLVLAGRLASDTDHRVGVVIQGDVTLRDGPHENAQGGQLPEGLEVKMLESVEGWLQVELAGGRRGWVAGEAVKQI